MKKKLIVLSVFVFVLLGFYISYNKSNEKTLNDFSVIKNENTIGLLLETEVGSGEYENADSETYPTQGYVFNSTLSKCENGGKISWDDTTKKVVFSGTTSDKCYIYFDKE